MNLLTIASHLVLPEVLLLVGACAVMIGDLFVKSERRGASFAGAQVVLLICLASTMFIQLQTGAQSFYLFNGLYVLDVMANLLKMAAYLSVSVTLVYARQYLIDRGLDRKSTRLNSSHRQ